jgi:hypothetical protein
MEVRDNKDKLLFNLQMENVRLNNEKASLKEYISLLENELKSIDEEHAQELALKDEFIADQAETISKLHKEKDSAKADAADARKELDEARAVILSLQGQIIECDSDKKQLEKENEYKQKLAELASRAKMDFKDIVNLLQNRIFNTNSDRTRYLNGAIDLNDPLIGEMGFEAIINEVLRQTDEVIGQGDGNADKDNTERPKYHKSGKTKKSQVGKSKKHHVFTKEILQKLGMDTSNLPEGSKLIHRKDKASGEDVWTVVLLHYQGPKTLRTEQEVGRFNVPKNDPMCSKHPESIIKGNPVMPSLASFYLNSKFGYSLSENRIIEMLTESGADIPQSTLNKWMHEIMTLMRERLQSRMLEVIKLSYFTQNDEVRVLVRSRKDKDGDFEYHVEYIHGCLSPEMKMVVMLYDEGTRSHSVPEEMIFRDSNIKCFIADRLSAYTTIVKDLEEYNLVRACCYFHGRHYWCDAYVSDVRALPVINLINSLFLVDKQAKDENMDSWQRLMLRLKYSEPIVRKLFKLLHQMKANIDDYGSLMKRAINYMLDDEKGFKAFLTDGAIELSNNAAERMFRHIAMGRRNWLHIGSHMAAQNVAFMYSLYESCRLNNINFGKYLNDILTRMMKGDTNYMTMLPCNYVAQEHEDELKVKECA